MELTIALCQMAIEPMQPLHNLARMENFVAQAKALGAGLVIFPEDAICGPLQGQTAFVQHAPAYLARMQQLAAKQAIDLVPGSWTVAEGTALFNQTFYINADGSIAGSYRKIHLWETEKAAITPGVATTVFPTRFGLCGLVICWDISFPVLFTAMAAQGVQLVIAPAYWSFTRPTGKAWRSVEKDILLIDSLCVARAFENNIIFAYCNAAGTLKLPGVHARLSGRSQITHPHEKVMARCDGNNEELLVTTVRR